MTQPFDNLPSLRDAWQLIDDARQSAETAALAGDPVRAAKALQPTIALLPQLADPFFEGQILCLYGEILIACQDYRESRLRLERAYECFMTCGCASALVRTTLLLAESFAAMQCWREALGHLTALLEAPTPLDPYSKIFAAVAAADVQLYFQKPDLAHRWLVTAKVLLRLHPFLALEARYHRTMVRLFILRNDPVRSTFHVRCAILLGEEIQDREGLGWAYAIRGALGAQHMQPLTYWWNMWKARRLLRQCRRSAASVVLARWMEQHRLWTVVRNRLASSVRSTTPALPAGRRESDFHPARGRDARETASKSSTDAPELPPR